MRFMLMIVVSLGMFAHAQQPPTKEYCDSLVKSLGPVGKLRAMPFKRLHDLEVQAFTCSSKYKVWAYSAADATISQAMLERCEAFIREQKLNDDLFAWDAKLYGQ